MLNKWSKYIWKLIWLVGLVILVHFGNEVEQIVRNYVSIKFNMQPLFWLHAIVPFILGIYISLLFVERWAFNFNLPLLLCVALPCSIIAFYVPIIHTTMAIIAIDSSSFSIPIPLWTMNQTTSSTVSVVAGLTLMFGLFGKKK